MISALLLSALTVNAAPAMVAKRQALGSTPGYLIQFKTALNSPYFGQELCLVANPDGTTNIGDGTPIGFINCENAQTESPNYPYYGLWDIQPGNQEGIQLIGTNVCIDAGENPGSMASTPAKVWQCYPGLPQQQFYYTNTDHIAVTNYSPCLDYSYSEGTNFVTCGSNYDNGDVQAFTTRIVSGGITPSSTPTSTATSSTMTSAMATSTPSASGRPIYWQNDESPPQCLTVTNGQFYDGSPVGIATCDGSAGQQWVYTYTGVTSVQVAGQNYCIDFGDNGGYDGVPMKIWQCYPGLFQQTMYYTGTNHIAVYNGNQCLDVEAGTQNVQGWQCSGPDVHQLWAPAGAGV